MSVVLQTQKPVIVAFTIDNNPDRYEKVKKIWRKNKIWMKKMIYLQDILIQSKIPQKRLKQKQKMCKETLKKIKIASEHE